MKKKKQNAKTKSRKTKKGTRVKRRGVQKATTKTYTKKITKKQKKVIKRTRNKQSKLVKKKETKIHSFMYNEEYIREEFSIKLNDKDFDWEITEFSDAFFVYSMLYPYLEKILKRFRTLKNRPRFMIGLQYFDGITNDNYAFSRYTDFDPHPDQLEQALLKVIEDLIENASVYDVIFIILTHLVLRTYKEKRKYVKKTKSNKKTRSVQKRKI